MDLSSTSFFHDHRMLCLTGPITSVVHSVQRNHQTLLFFSIPGIALVLYFILVRLVLDKYLERCDLPPSVPSLSVLSIGPFFRRRFEFLNWGFRITGQSAFRFRLLNETVIVLSGESARKAFLTTRCFDLTEGFKVLSGAIPMVRGVTSDLQTNRIAVIHKRLASVQRTEHFVRLLPFLVEDCRRGMEQWGRSGTFDPFVKIYELIFQTTVRSLSCHDLADNRDLVAQLKALYDELDSGTTPATVLLPWIPTPAMLKKLWSTKKIYDILVQAIEEREKSSVVREDTLQFLLDSGDDRLLVIGFIIGLLVAGARATGTTSSWLIIFLGANPDWRIRAQTEVETLLATFSAPSSSISQALSAIPLKAWESSTPVLDSIIKETLRVAQPHTAMRRNIGSDDVWINGKRIPAGAYVLYPFSDVHLDPELYPNPWEWTPGRPEPKHVAFGSIEFGSGKTICLGQRLAKLELKIMTSMFLVGFAHSVVDNSAHSVPAPQPNWNDTLLCRPTDDCLVRYERSDATL